MDWRRYRRLLMDYKLNMMMIILAFVSHNRDTSRQSLSDSVYNATKMPKTPLPVSHEDIPYDGTLDLERQRLFQQIVG